MSLDFRIISIDFYQLTKEACIELARSYSLKLPSNPSDIRSRELRPKLALLKDIYKLAHRDSEFAAVLEHLRNSRTLPSENLEKYPQLNDCQDLFENVYDEVARETPSLHDTASSNLHGDTSIFSSNRLPVNSSQTIVNNNIAFDSGYLLHNTFLPSTTQPRLRTPILNSLFERELEQDNLLSSGRSYLPSGNSHSFNGIGLRLAPQTHHPIPSEQNRNESTAMAEAEIIPPVKPTSYSGLSHENVTDFITKFNLVAKINRWRDETKINLLLTYVSGYASKWLSSYMKDNPGVTWNVLEENFLKAFGQSSHKYELQNLLETRVQSDAETPLQYYYTIRNLCQQIDPAMSEELIINHTIKGLNPTLFDKIVACNNTSLAVFQENLSKLEIQAQMKLQNARKFGFHANSTPTSGATASNGFTHENSVHFDNELGKHDIVAALADIRNHMRNLDIEHDRRTRRDYSPHSSRNHYHHSPADLRRGSPHYGSRDDFRTGRYEQRNNYRANHHDYREDRRPADSRDRWSRSKSPHQGRSPWRYQNDSKYSDRRSFTKHRTPERGCKEARADEQKRYDCEICNNNSHQTKYCKFNPRNGDACMKFRTKNGAARGRERSRTPSRDNKQVTPERDQDSANQKN